MGAHLSPMTSLVLLISCLLTTTTSFTPPKPSTANKRTTTIPTTQQRKMVASSSSYLLEPTERDTHYGTKPMNVAQYLIDLHDTKSTFDFCGGMMFQLVLSDKLRQHLQSVATSSPNDSQPIIFDKSKARMFDIPEYSQNASADNIRLFHGREIRKVPHATGGMGFVLQLSLADGNDPEGWTDAEIEGYDGWGHDVGRVWRKGPRLEEEGFENFRTRFGLESFALHHRFYLHFDGENRMWLSAEDGCEGTPGEKGVGFLSSLFGR